MSFFLKKQFYVFTILFLIVCNSNSCKNEKGGRQTQELKYSQSIKKEIFNYILIKDKEFMLGDLFRILDEKKFNIELIDASVEGSRDIYQVYHIGNGDENVLLVTTGKVVDVIDKSGTQDTLINSLRIYLKIDGEIYESAGDVYLDKKIVHESSKKIRLNHASGTLEKL